MRDETVERIEAWFERMEKRVGWADDRVEAVLTIILPPALVLIWAAIVWGYFTSYPREESLATLGVSLLLIASYRNRWLKEKARADELEQEKHE